MQASTVEALTKSGVAGLLVDRYRFRELLDGTPSAKEVWPAGMAIVLSLDLAGEPDIRKRLLQTRWDLLIAEHADVLVGARSPRLREILSSAHRVVLTGSRDLEVPQALLANATVVEWRRDRLVDGSGKPLITWPRPALHEVPFRLTSFELDLRRGVKNLCRLLESISAERRITTLILRRLRSSPPAIEAVLRRLVEGQGSYFHSSQISAAKAADQAERSRTGQIIAKEAIISALQALQQVEELPSDSKLDAFGKRLDQIIAERGSAGRICVLTEYLASMFYLAADMEGRGIPCHEVHGEMGAEDRDRVLESLSRFGGVLVTTRAPISENVNLSEFEDLVLYDLPPSKLALQELLAAFNRFGRIEPLNVHVLKAAEAEDPLKLLERSIVLSELRKVPA
jgi:hypothetical protein